MSHAYFIIASVALASFPVHAATTLKDVILANESSGSPMAKVVVADGTNAHAT
jgi:hypothetical protein